MISIEKGRAALLAILLCGCSQSPTEPTEPCTGCAAPGATPPSEAEVEAALLEGQRWAAQTCTIVNTALPTVQWWRCRTWTWGYDTPGGAPSWFCASGTTSEDGRTVYLYYGNPSNTLLLARWEGRNSAWKLNRCGNQAYRSEVR